MKYTYAVDYALVSNQGFSGNGDICFERSTKLTARDINELRSRILAGAHADWNKNPVNQMMRECPIRSIAILNIFEDVSA